jgi:hypothetical protein
VPTQKKVEYVKLMARAFMLDIPEPISFSALLERLSNRTVRRDEKFLLDETQEVLSQLRITVATLDNSCIKYLPENN